MFSFFLCLLSLYASNLLTSEKWRRRKKKKVEWEKSIDQDPPFYNNRHSTKEFFSLLSIKIIALRYIVVVVHTNLISYLSEWKIQNAFYIHVLVVFYFLSRNYGLRYLIMYYRSFFFSSSNQIKCLASLNQT